MKRLAVGVLVASALTAAAPAIAQAPTLTLAISRVAGGPQGTTTFVRFGELVRVSGSISTGAANRPVDLQISPYGGTMQTIRLTTDSSGAFRYSHRPQIRTSYMARSGGQASSQEVYAHVRPKVGLRVLNARLRRFRVTMQAIPEQVSHVVLFQRRVTPSRWRTVKRVRVATDNLTAVFTARLPRGVQRVRIVVPQTPGYLRGFSAFVRVRFHRPVDTRVVALSSLDVTGPDIGPRQTLSWGRNACAASSRTAPAPTRPRFRSAPDVAWSAGDTIPLGSKRALRVLDKRLDENLEGDPVQVLIVEPAN